MLRSVYAMKSYTISKKMSEEIFSIITRVEYIQHIPRNERFSKNDVTIYNAYCFTTVQDGCKGKFEVNE